MPRFPHPESYVVNNNVTPVCSSPCNPPVVPTAFSKRLLTTGHKRPKENLQIRVVVFLLSFAFFKTALSFSSSLENDLKIKKMPDVLPLLKVETRD